MNRLRLIKLGVELVFAAPAHLPPFVGNTIRGAFGSALMARGGDAFLNVFKNENAESAPNPFVISAAYPSKGNYAAGDTLTFSMALIGAACGYKDDVVETLNDICRGKLENARVQRIAQQYDREWRDEGADTIPYCDTLSLNFVTPTEILSKKEALTAIDFDVFTDSLFGRISGLFDATGSEFVLPYKLIAAKPHVKTDCALKQIEFQTSGQPISGFVGKVTFYGDVTRYLPYIDIGSQIHIGKKTTRSCGQYTFEI